MGEDKVTETLSRVIALYSVHKYFSVLYDKMFVLVKLGQTLADPAKTSEVRKCFEGFSNDLERWRCVLMAIGAEDIWDKYKDVWARIEGMGGDNK
jgi:hypothetical protein